MGQLNLPGTLLRGQGEEWGDAGDAINSDAERYLILM